MPRYFFDITDGETRLDEDGEELEDLAAARVAALLISGELLKCYPDRFWVNGEWRCSVRNEAGRVLFTLHVLATEGAAVFNPQSQRERPSNLA